MPDDDDIQIQSYQDDLNTDDNAVDPIMDEETDDPVKGFRVPADEFKNELDKLAVDDLNVDAIDPDETDLRDDQLNNIEDEDEDPEKFPGNPS
ncbi:MAG: hypothetical protein JWN75_276 [Candidatus Saccharibacteria bacterium]|nr:hypothetical protein [Candidatus Saccharibacteria bacterium]